MSARAVATTNSSAISTAERYRRLKPGPGRSAPEVAADQRGRLERAMIELSAREGYETVTVRKLIRLARVSSGTFYSQFEGADECLLAAYRGVMEKNRQRVADTRSPELQQMEQVGRTIRALLAQPLSDRDMARFALIEVYAGGPAAIAAVSDEEAKLEGIVRQCLSRRGQPVSRSAAAAVLAAAFHCARRMVDEESPDNDASEMVEALVDWAGDLIDGTDQGSMPPDSLEIDGLLVGRDGDSVQPHRRRDERGLILDALLRLGSIDGYFSLTPDRVSATAGIPVARLKRHFTDLADGYLQAIRHTCRTIFSELTASPSQVGASRSDVSTCLLRATRRASADPLAARLTFARVVEPGKDGATCRREMISELAAAWRDATPAPERPSAIRAEAMTAALWSAFAASSCRVQSRANAC